MSKYGEPWKFSLYAELRDDGWTDDSCGWLEDSGGNTLGECIEVETGERAARCVNACVGLSDESLEAGVIGKVREALEIAVGFVAVWGGRYQAEYGLDAVHPTHQEALEKVQAALALLQESSQ